MPPPSSSATTPRHRGGIDRLYRYVGAQGFQPLDELVALRRTDAADEAAEKAECEQRDPDYLGVRHELRILSI